tara:strand:+ start:375 stop:524 length:150 start_codon:yes stop_codon:yes gene_type:complete
MVIILPLWNSMVPPLEKSIRLYAKKANNDIANNMRYKIFDLVVLNDFIF